MAFKTLLDVVWAGDPAAVSLSQQLLFATFCISSLCLCLYYYVLKVQEKAQTSPILTKSKACNKPECSNPYSFAQPC